jgi:hypothetical protein
MYKGRDGTKGKDAGREKIEHLEEEQFERLG